MRIDNDIGREPLKVRCKNADIIRCYDQCSYQKRNSYINHSFTTLTFPFHIDHLTMPKQHTEEYGWPAVPRDRSNLPEASDARSDVVDIDFESIWPKTEVVKQAQQYIKENLPQEVYNHSLRVYCYGTPPFLHAPLPIRSAGRGTQIANDECHQATRW